MKFFSQLVLLTWKNLCLRRRQKIRLVVELIWPVLLFLVIALVRSGQMPQARDECHFISKALPSGGLLPLFQSFLCDFQSQCFENETYGEQSGKVNNFRDAGLTVLLHDAELIMSNKTTMESFQMFFGDITELSNILPLLEQNPDAIPGSQTPQWYESQLNGRDANELHRNALQLTVSVANQLTQLEDFNNLIDDINRITLENDTDTLVCGSVGEMIDFTNISLDAGGGGQGLGAFGDLLSVEETSQPVLVRQKRSEDSFDDLKETKTDCEWVEEIRATEMGELMWVKLKPMVQGYILYTPDTNATKRIMSEAEKPLTSIATVKTLAEKWQTFSPLLRKYIETTSAFDMANDFNRNSELKGQAEEMLKRNSPVDFIELQKMRMNAKNSDSENNVTTSLLDAIDAIDEFANTTLVMLECVNLDKVRGFSTLEEFEAAAGMLQQNHTFWGGVVFEGFNSSADNDTIPHHVVYQLRTDSSMVRSTEKYKQTFWLPGPMSDVLFYGEYLTGGFVFLQDMLDQGIIRASLRVEDSGAGTYVQEFPYPCYVDDFFISSLGAALPLFMVLAWIFSVAMTIKGIVLEKELRLKEVMKVMGMGDGVHWVAWFIDSFAVMFISSCLLVLVFKVGNIAINTDPSVLLFMLVSFSVSTITFSFLISCFFSQANLAAACGAVIFFMTYVPYTMAYTWDAVLPLPVKVVLCLSNTMAFGYSSQYVSLFEIQSEGIQWHNINETPISTGDSMTFLEVMGMLWLDAFLYMLFTWYIEGVFPGAYGIPRPFNFPFLRSYWCGSQTTDTSDSELLASTTKKNDIGAVNSDFEQEPTHLKLGASISKLYKIYKTGNKLAVNNLSINFYEGQITSFLGHNGAGKTTTMSILTGLFPPTAGTAYIYGKDILKDITGIRKSLGMCPQHNVLFDFLTVAEHLWFYAKVKGARKLDISIEMEQMLKHLHLQNKRDELVTNLSGGMKRKLSIAIAFVGGSKMVILDEPTAGIDPYARREIWELLGRYKEGRTIIMSTHHMDEADVLGDRIAIISAGQLRCSGSSLFLKSRFGNGYYLVLNKKMPGDDTTVTPPPTDPTEMTGLDNAAFVTGATEEEKVQDTTDEMKVNLTSEDDDMVVKKAKPPIDIPDCGSCQESIVSSFIKSYVPGASLCENLGTELSYMLPSTATQGCSLEVLFKDLDIFKDELYISNFGISDTSLEEVFLSVTDDVGVFSQGSTTQGTDDGNLPRPFMGRGSLKRRSYQLPAKSESVKERRKRSVRERRSRSVDSDEHALISDDEVNVELGESDGDANIMHSVNLHDGDDDADGNQASCSQDPINHSDHGTNQEKAKQETSRFQSFKSSIKKLNRQSTHQRSPSKMRQQISQKKSQQLMRKASRQANEIQNTNVSVASVRMPDTENDPCPQNLTNQDEDQNMRAVINLIRRQFYALIVKRFHHFRRSKKGFFAQVILPVVFVCVAMVFTVTEPVRSEPEKLPLVPWLTGTPNYIFYSNDEPTSSLAAAMEESIVQDNPGISTRCMEDNVFGDNGFSCEPQLSGEWKTETMEPDLYEKFLNDELTCFCSGQGFEVCLPGAEGPPPPERMVPTTDILQNYSDMGISHYVKTTTLDYVWQRFGGVSFLETNEMAPLTLNISKDIMAMWKENNQNPIFPISDNTTATDPVVSESLLPSESTLDDMYTVLLSLARYKNIKVWWDNSGYHALPSFINVGGNVIIRGNIEESQRDEYGISAYNYPINMTGDQIQEKIEKQMPIIMGTAIFVVFALAFVPASFIVFLISERETKSKHLQIVSGVSPTTYWVTTLLWDLVNYLIPAMLTVVVFLCFGQQAYVSTEALPVTVVLLLLYGWAVTPMTYPVSFVFTTPSTAYLSMACTTMLVGSLCIMTTFILEFLGGSDESSLLINDSMKKVFLVFPPFCLGRGLVDMAIISLTAELSGSVGKEVVATSPWSWEITGRNMVALGIEGIIFFVLTLLIENKFFFKPRHIDTEHDVLTLEDDDVARERHRVLSGAANGDIVRVANLTKDYNTTRGIFTAVDRMCVGIPLGECFGLLGVNGAGKTTTFKMLTGDTQVTSGSAYVNGYSILKDMKNVRHSIGYCPQFDALNELLTAEEHLAFYARLRGIPENDIDKVVQWGIRKLGLTLYAKRVAGTYSGGNKRKLSTAIALIGDPQLVFLDEPTAGMDPKARRFLWNRITNIIKEGRSVILTSHSMEECEALCTRVAIMVNGRYKCLGSPQHLKTKFGDGYTISIRVGGDPPILEPLMIFVAETFPYTVLRERRFNMLEYQMPSTSTSLANLFGAFDSNKERFCIEDYSISQTTLDQVFINFAKEQTTGMEDMQQASAMGLTVINTTDGNLPDANQMVVSPDMCTVQFVPDNSTVGGFAFATASIFGGFIHHDNQPGNSTSQAPSPPPGQSSEGSYPEWSVRQDSRSFTNHAYGAPGGSFKNHVRSHSAESVGKAGCSKLEAMREDDEQSGEEISHDVPGHVGQSNDTLVRMSDLEQLAYFPISQQAEETIL